MSLTAVMNCVFYIRMALRIYTKNSGVIGLTFHDRERDVLAVGAYDNGKLIGLSGCSADCEMMYQIGVDVLPEYRRKGVASAVTSRLALEVLALGKVPFYCAAWSNIKSVRNAVKSGFRPAWVELTARNKEFVSELIK